MRRIQIDICCQKFIKEMDCVTQLQEKERLIKEELLIVIKQNHLLQIEKLLILIQWNN